MRYILGFLVAIALALTVYAQADNSTTDRPAAPGMRMRGGQMGTDKMMSMPDDMKQRCRMMMQTAINPGDPAAILALKDDLKLTADQVQKLQAIADKAREEAKGVLDEQQAKALQAVPAKPETSMAMHQHMMQMMKGMRGGQPGGQMMNCPMMNMMGGAATSQPQHPAQDESLRRR